MAARLRKTHQDDVRVKIQATQLINVLQNHALGKTKRELSPSRLKAIEILLRKSVPDLTQMDAAMMIEADMHVDSTLTVNIKRFS